MCAATAARRCRRVMSATGVRALCLCEHSVRHGVRALCLCEHSVWHGVRALCLCEHGVRRVRSPRCGPASVCCAQCSIQTLNPKP